MLVDGTKPGAEGRPPRSQLGFHSSLFILPNKGVVEPIQEVFILSPPRHGFVSISNVLQQLGWYVFCEFSSHSLAAVAFRAFII